MLYLVMKNIRISLVPLDLHYGWKRERRHARDDPTSRANKSPCGAALLMTSKAEIRDDKQQ